VIARKHLRNRARIRADQTDSTFPTDEEYNLLLDEAARETWYDLVQSGWPVASEEWTVQADGSQSYPLGDPRTLATFSFGAYLIRWVDDAEDPTPQNDWTVWVDSHLGSPAIQVLLDDDLKTVTLDYSSNAMPAPTIGELAEALRATGRLEPVGDNWVTDAAVGFSASTGLLGSFSGASAGSDPVAMVTGVWALEGAQRRQLRRLNEGRRAAMESQQSGQATAYEVVVSPSGTSVRLYPRTAAGPVLVGLIREWPGFASDVDRWHGPARSDELVVLAAAAKGMRKEGDDQGAAQLDRERGMLLERVTAMAHWLHMRDPLTIRDEGLEGAFGSMRRDPFDYEV
jgi:hypothetical protein